MIASSSLILLASFAAATSAEAYFHVGSALGTHPSPRKLQEVKIDPNSHGFIDTTGRQRIFHGMNAVYKIAPWHPDVSGFDFQNSLSAVDASNLRKWGFNIVRLGVMWPGVEPIRGSYNSTYLDQIETIVDQLASEGIYTILDFHQDLWHRKFCGEGVPDWLYETCVSEEPEGTKEFPLPAVRDPFPYPQDEDGNPTLDACLSTSFAQYYLSAEVGAGFQCLYDNKAGLWNAMGAYWQQIAMRFRSTSSVLGYELINEPWMGDVYEDKRRFLPGEVEKTYLQPLYQHLHTMIRKVDDEKIIFWEGLTVDYWPSGFSASPGPVNYNDRQALAYHIYCPMHDPTVKTEAACDVINSELFAMRLKDADRLGGGLVMTEFGASRDIRGDLYALNYLAEKMDAHHQSWMYWQFKYYNDITTCTPEGEALYTNDGVPCEHKLRVLSRTYPMAVAGALGEYKFHTGQSAELTAPSGMFTMDYEPWAGATSNATTATSLCPVSRTTSVYYNEELYYPKGVQVDIKYRSKQSGGEVERLPDGATLDVHCDDHQFVSLRHSAAATDSSAPASASVAALEDVLVHVTMRPCMSDNRVMCTCSSK